MTVEIRGVKARPVMNPRWRGTRYDIYTSPPGAVSWTEKVSTLDAWKASLCDRAWKSGRVVTLGTRDTRFGPELVTIEWEP